MQKIQSASSSDSVMLIRDFLQNHHSGVLATADVAGNPHAAIIYFSADDNFYLTFATKTETQKYKNMAENNQVAFVCSDESTQTTVQITGKVEEVTDPEEHQAALNRMYRFSETISKTELPPVEKLYAGDYITLRIVPQIIKMGVFRRPDAESNEELYETLMFQSN
jgi:nitroimidazol reductase NimA-like FMN-containing flavoprotein (pyridoxamine 5'-phosphate oxidase superfamily)